jgi:hypothetical protein
MGDTKLFLPHTRRSESPSGSVQLGGNVAFPICPECDAQALKAVIRGLKPRHPNTARISALLLAGRRAEEYAR